MSEELESYPEMPLDFSTFVANKMATKTSAENKSSVDPYQMMVNRKKLEAGEMVEMPEAVYWPESDMKALNDFCEKHGILGFNCGRMSPIAALAFLKNKMGIVDGPLEERVPYGYTRMGQSSNKASILHG
jgi:hypothetical protein